MEVRTCAVCNGDCHNQNIRNFAKSTEWRDKADKLLLALQALLEVHGKFRRAVIEGEITGKIPTNDWRAYDLAQKTVREAIGSCGGAA